MAVERWMCGPFDRRRKTEEVGGQRGRYVCIEMELWKRGGVSLELVPHTHFHFHFHFHYSCSTSGATLIFSGKSLAATHDRWAGEV